MKNKPLILRFKEKIKEDELLNKNLISYESSNSINNELANDILNQKYFLFKELIEDPIYKDNFVLNTVLQTNFTVFDIASYAKRQLTEHESYLDRFKDLSQLIQFQDSSSTSLDAHKDLFNDSFNQASNLDSMISLYKNKN